MCRRSCWRIHRPGSTFQHPADTGDEIPFRPVIALARFGIQSEYFAQELQSAIEWGQLLPIAAKGTVFSGPFRHGEPPAMTWRGFSVAVPILEGHTNERSRQKI